MQKKIVLILTVILAISIFTYTFAKSSVFVELTDGGSSSSSSSSNKGSSSSSSSGSSSSSSNKGSSSSSSSGSSSSSTNKGSSTSSGGSGSSSSSSSTSSGGSGSSSTSSGGSGSSSGSSSGCSHATKEYSYELYSDTQHKRITKCTSTCKKIIATEYFKHSIYNGKCTYCGYTEETPAKCSADGVVAGHSPRKMEVKSNSITHMEGEHYATYWCQTCGVSWNVTEPCNLKSDGDDYGYDDNYHWTAQICSDCGYRKAIGEKQAHTNGAWEQCSSDTRHKRRCTVCRRPETENHTFVDRVCTKCGYQQDHVYGMDGRCIDCGKVVSFVSGAFLNISNWSDYTPGDPGISSWSNSTVTITIDGKWQQSGTSNIKFNYQFYTAHNKSWHDGVAELFKQDRGYSTSYTGHLEYMGEVHGGGSIAGTVSKNGSTITFSGVPTSGRVKASFSIYGTVKRYTNGGSVSNDPPPALTDIPKDLPAYNQVTIKHVDLSTGNLMIGTKITTKQLPLENESSLTLSGPWANYVNKGATLDGENTPESKKYLDTQRVYLENVPNNGKDRELIYYYQKEDANTINLTTSWIDVSDGHDILTPETKGIEIGKVQISESKESYITPMGYKLLSVDMVVSGNKSVAHTSKLPLPLYTVEAKKTGNFTINGQSVTTSKDININFYYEKERYTLTVKYQDEDGNTLVSDKVTTLPEVPTTETKIEIPDYDFKESQKNSDPRTPSETVTVGDKQENTVVVFVYKQPKEEEVPFVDVAEQIVLRSNNKGAEEYNVDYAIPTSEDLYTCILANGFVLEYKLEQVKKTQTFSYTYRQWYREELYDDFGNRIGTEEDYVPLTVSENVDVYYWRPTYARLYKITEGKVKNELIGEVTLTPVKYDVKLEYTEGGAVSNTSGGNDLDEYAESLEEAQDIIKGINTNIGPYGGHVTLDTTSDIQRLINSASVKMSTLKVTGECLNGGFTVLSGQYVPIVTSASYRPATADSNPKVPTIKDDVLYKDDNLFVKIKANDTYLTTGSVTYTYDASSSIGSAPASTVITKDLTGNPVNVHTPVVNYTEIKYTDEQKDKGPQNTLVENLEKQFEREKITTLVLGKEFTLKIPHNGNHIDQEGYGSNRYNYRGLQANGEDAKWGSNNKHFAVKKQVKFTCGVIFVNDPSVDNGKGNKYYEKDKWIDLKNDQEEYKFIISEWEKELWKTDKHTVTTRVIAENAGEVGFTDYTTNSPSGITNTVDKYNKDKTQYIAEWNQKVNVIGEILDLEIRATNDPGWTGLKETLDLSKAPLGQPGQNQNTAYKYGIKLGYSAYFDVTTTGWYGDTSESIKITPKYYFVDEKGGRDSVKEVDLYYKTSQSGQYLSLKNNPIALSTIMNQDVIKGKGYWSHFANKVGNGLGLFSMDGARELSNTARLLASPTITSNLIGKGVVNYALSIGIGSSSQITLPYQTRLAYSKALETLNNNSINNFREKYKLSSLPNVPGTDYCIGHWYGAIRLPNSTIAVDKGTTPNPDGSNKLQKGYILVTFEKVTTGDPNGEDYLEHPPVDDSVPVPPAQDPRLPNGNTFPAPDPNIPVVIYELIPDRMDYEVGGTH